MRDRRAEVLASLRMEIPGSNMVNELEVMMEAAKRHQDFLKRKTKRRHDKDRSTLKSG